MDLEPRPEVEALEVKAFHGALGLGEAGDHRVRLVGESSDVEVSVGGPEDADDEGFGGGLGEGVSVEDDEAGDERRRELVGQEIDDEDARGDEEDGVGGVEREAVVSGEFGGNFGR